LINTAGSRESEPRVIEAQQFQHGGMEVMHCDRVFGDAVADLVRLAEFHA
jgi:hypothetical protein